MDSLFNHFVKRVKKYLLMKIVTKKELKFEGFIKLTGDLEVDYAYLRKMYEGAEGFNLHQAAPIRPLPSQESKK